MIVIRISVRHHHGISAGYEIGRFFVRLGIAITVAVVLAALWALVNSGPYRESLRVTFYIVGGLAFVLAASGGSPSRRDGTSATWAEKWANADTFAVNRENPPERTLGTAVLLCAVGTTLIILAAVVV